MNLFRNLTLFRLPAAVLNDLQIQWHLERDWSVQDCPTAAIDACFTEHALRPIGDLELSSQGFVSPFGRGESELAYQTGDAMLLTLGGELRVIPGPAVTNAVADELDRIRKEEGRVAGARERKRIKEAVLTELLPRVIPRPWRLQAYLDFSSGWCVIDTSSRKAAENFVSAVREALGSFPAVPANAESSPRALLTSWIAGEPMPDGFVLGDECELRDPVDAGAIIKCRRQELEADEIREHLKTGKQAFKVAVTFNDRLSFVIGEDLVIRKLKFLEAAMESLEQGERDSQRAEIEAVFALMSGELRVLLARLGDVLALSEVTT